MCYYYQATTLLGCCSLVTIWGSSVKALSRPESINSVNVKIQRMVPGPSVDPPGSSVSILQARWNFLRRGLGKGFIFRPTAHEHLSLDVHYGMANLHVKDMPGAF